MSEEIKNESKNQRGGKRKNAGRKPSTVKGLIRKLPGDLSKMILAQINSESKWLKLAESDDPKLQFEVLKYLTDRAHGKAKQSIEHGGPEGGPIQASVKIEFV